MNQISISNLYLMPDVAARHENSLFLDLMVQMLQHNNSHELCFLSQNPMQSMHASGGFRVAGRQAPLKLQPSRHIARSENGASQKKEISEDVLQRLRVAEEEAAALRQELAKARAEALAKVFFNK